MDPLLLPAPSVEDVPSCPSKPSVMVDAEAPSNPSVPVVVVDEVVPSLLLQATMANTANRAMKCFPIMFRLSLGAAY